MFCGQSDTYREVYSFEPRPDTGKDKADTASHDESVISSPVRLVLRKAVIPGGTLHIYSDVEWGISGM